MKKNILKIYLLPFIGLFVCVSIFLSSYISGPPAASTNAPGENSCFASPACHGGTPNTGVGFSEITVMGGVPAGNLYTPNTTYPMMPYIIDTTKVNSGLQVVARLTNGNNAGTTIITMPTTTQKITAGGYEYVEQTSTGAVQPIFANMHDRMFDWQAPPPGSGTVTFYLATIAGDGNNNPSGDNVYTDTLVLYEDTSSSIIELNQLQDFTVNKIYPLPANNFINFELSANKNLEILVSIIDIEGKVVIESSFNINSLNKNLYKLNISAINNGIYFIKFSQAGRTSLFKKIVKI